MSDVTDEKTKHAVYAGIVVDVAEADLDRVQKLLAGISGGWQKAVGSALSRAAAAGRTEAKRPVLAEYAIDQSTYLRETRTINHFEWSADGSISVAFAFAGYVIPLLQFNTSVDSSGRVVTQVKRNGAAETLNHAFKAQMGPHIGIYERTGAGRFPVKELYGPATPQMMYSNEAVMDAVEEKMADTYNRRIEHEVDALLNGWRR